MTESEKRKYSAGLYELPSELDEIFEAYNTFCNAEFGQMQNETKIENALYHYTNATGLKGILESKKIWFTDFRHLNDPSEFFHGIEIICETISLINESASAEVQRCFGLLLHLLNSDISSSLDFYIASFSQRRNDLGQWRSYADNGRGYNLGFAPEVFAPITDVITKPEEAVFAGKIEYDRKINIHRARKIIEPLIKIIDGAILKYPQHFKNKIILHEFVAVLAKLSLPQFFWHALTTKHPAYEHEKEIRLIIIGMHTKLQEAKAIKTRLRGGEIVPYLESDDLFRKLSSPMEIIVGPTAVADAERTVRTFLEISGYEADKVKIDRSDIPYRSF